MHIYVYRSSRGKSLGHTFCVLVLELDRARRRIGRKTRVQVFGGGMNRRTGSKVGRGGEVSMSVSLAEEISCCRENELHAKENGLHAKEH